MIAGKFYNGSGLGNMLHRLVATRVKAADLGVDWSMMYINDGAGKEMGFKGQSFMDIGDWNKPVIQTCNVWQEKKVRENGVDISPFDPEFNFIEDNTIIDGEFQDERYWEHREKEVNEWLKVENPWKVTFDHNAVVGEDAAYFIPNDLCVIGFRGGEFALYPDLFLTKDYWDESIKMMREINPNMRFEVHTDDVDTAFRFFPDFHIIHDIGLNWRSMRYAKYAIIANSSFFILPRWLRNGITISPRFWGRRNTKVWSMAQNYYKRFQYI